MNKITYTQIENYLSGKTLSNSQPYRSVLESFRFLNNKEILSNENLDQLYTRFVIGKSEKSAKFCKSVVYGFVEQLGTNTQSQNATQQQNTVVKTNHESNTITTTTTTKTTIVKEISLEESKKAFKFSLLAIQKE